MKRIFLLIVSIALFGQTNATKNSTRKYDRLAELKKLEDSNHRGTRQYIQCCKRIQPRIPGRNPEANALITRNTINPAQRTWRAESNNLSTFDIDDKTAFPLPSAAGKENASAQPRDTDIPMRPKKTAKRNRSHRDLTSRLVVGKFSNLPSGPRSF